MSDEFDINEALQQSAQEAIEISQGSINGKLHKIYVPSNLDRTQRKYEKTMKMNQREFIDFLDLNVPDVLPDPYDDLTQ